MLPEALLPLGDAAGGTDHVLLLLDLLDKVQEESELRLLLIDGAVAQKIL